VSREPSKQWKRVPKYKMLYESGAENLALNPRIELFMRIFWLAMWFAKPNGHANFQQGAIPTLLNANDRSVRKARAKAIDNGMLRSTSGDRCLALPAGLVGNRLRGHDLPCEICTGVTAPPKTSMLMRDREAEASFGELYRSETKAQAAAVLAEPVVPTPGTSGYRSGCCQELGCDADPLPSNGMWCLHHLRLPSAEWLSERETGCDLMKDNAPQHQEIA
jgi:hypothetical protein